MDSAPNRHAIWLSEAECRLEEFKRLVERQTDAAACPYAKTVTRNVPSDFGFTRATTALFLQDTRRVTVMVETGCASGASRGR